MRNTVTAATMDRSAKSASPPYLRRVRDCQIASNCGCVMP